MKIWRLHKLYRDTESGTHMNRPGLEEMLYDAGARAFDTLLVFRVDRLSRKVREIALGPKGAFENGNISTLTRQVPADRVVSAIPRRSLLPAITESSVFPHVESFP